MTDVSVLVAGAGGRMGRAIITEAMGNTDVVLVGGVEHAGALTIGKDLGALVGLPDAGMTVGSGLAAGLTSAQAVIDFTLPDASLAIAHAAAAAGVAHVIGTTGFSDAQLAELETIASSIPIVKSGNMSLGVNLLLALVEQAARAMEKDFDIEIMETHHGAKLDAPSGTALMLGEAAAAGRGVELGEKAVGIDGNRVGERRAGDIGFSVVRGGGVIGDHAVQFLGDSEVITLSHHAIDRSLFAKGALAAAKWVAGRRPGLYSMQDVLGL